MALRDLTQFHENPAAIAAWQRWTGRGLVWLTPPARRRAIMAAAAVLVGINSTVKTMARNEALQVPAHGIDLVLMVLAQFALLWLVYLAAMRFAQLPAACKRHPQLMLHGSYWLVLVVLWLTVPNGGLWRGLLMGLAILYPVIIWRLAYLLLAGQHKRMAGTGMHDHLLYLWPVYGGSNTPYGKGLPYLSQYEAKTTEELARSQLAGFKLLALAVAWRLVLTLFEGVFYSSGNRLTPVIGGHTVGMPTLEDLLGQGSAASTPESWLAIYCAFFSHVLRLAIKGHMIIGVLRICGFNVFRNTYKPLLAESVVEFWNRYFYYFKELLSTFFFMPTFTGFGKRLARWPALRLFVAVFAAAFVGNVYYHVIRDAGLVASGHGLDVLWAHRSRMFYCLLLAIGIFVSMQREQGRRGDTSGRWQAPRWLRIFGVWTFFGFIYIWNVDSAVPFLTRVDFFLGLFGLHNPYSCTAPCF